MSLMAADLGRLTSKDGSPGKKSNHLGYFATHDECIGLALAHRMIDIAVSTPSKSANNQQRWPQAQISHRKSDQEQLQSKSRPSDEDIRLERWRSIL